MPPPPFEGFRSRRTRAANGFPPRIGVRASGVSPCPGSPPNACPCAARTHAHPHFRSANTQKLCRLHYNACFQMQLMLVIAPPGALFCMKRQQAAELTLFPGTLARHASSSPSRDSSLLVVYLHNTLITCYAGPADAMASAIASECECPIDSNVHEPIDVASGGSPFGLRSVSAPHRCRCRAPRNARAVGGDKDEAAGPANSVVSMEIVRCAKPSARR